MNVQERADIRELAAAEVDQVRGGSQVLVAMTLGGLLYDAMVDAIIDAVSVADWD